MARLNAAYDILTKTKGSASDATWKILELEDEWIIGRQAGAVWNVGKLPHEHPVGVSQGEWLFVGKRWASHGSLHLELVSELDKYVLFVSLFPSCCGDWTRNGATTLAASLQRLVCWWLAVVWGLAILRLVRWILWMVRSFFGFGCSFKVAIKLLLQPIWEPNL